MKIIAGLFAPVIAVQTRLCLAFTAEAKNYPLSLMIDFQMNGPSGGVLAKSQSLWSRYIHTNFGWMSVGNNSENGCGILSFS